MRRSISVCLAILLTGPWVLAGEISPAGEKLARALDETHVEKLWLAKHEVNWETGKSLGPSIDDGKSHTHCSAFAAAVAMRHNVYLLRPPEHSTNLLSNAQLDWLRSEGSRKGWKSVKGGVEAQELANKGYLVVAVYKNPDPKKPGHVAIIRPSNKSEKALAAEGPQVIMSGMINFNSTSLKEGFRFHPHAYRDGEIHFFAHKLELK